MSTVYFPVFSVRGNEAEQHLAFITGRGHQEFLKYLDASGVEMVPDGDLPEHGPWSGMKVDHAVFQERNYAITTNRNIPQVSVYLRHFTNEVEHE